MEIIAPPAFTDELSIVWLDDPRRHRYLREKMTVSSSRSRKPRVDRLVAYAIVSRDTPLPCLRRVWVLHADDPYEPDGPGRPTEAVDPFSIQPGRRSRSVFRRHAEEVTWR